MNMFFCSGTHTHTSIYRVKAGGSPELPRTLSLVMYNKRRNGIEMGGWGGGGMGGCNNVMWTALD